MIYDARSFVHYPPNIDDILDGNEDSLPNRGQYEYLVATGAMMIRRVNEDNAVTFMRLMLQFPAEVSILIMKIGAYYESPLEKWAPKEYRMWTEKYKEKVF